MKIRPVAILLTSMLCCASADSADGPNLKQSNPTNSRLSNSTGTENDPPKGSSPNNLETTASVNGRDLNQAANWPLERVELTDGRTFSGLIRSQNNGQIVLVVVQRPPGRPMYLVVRRWPLESVAKVHSLLPDEQSVLAERISRFKSRGLEEVREMTGLQLKRGGEDGPDWNYEQGPWFQLESWTDEEMTRRAIVRIEQVFAAYSEILPVRNKPVRPLKILLYGSMRDYNGYLKEQDYRLENPAVFNAKSNVLAAGSELSRYAQQLADVRGKHLAVKKKYEKMASAMPEQLSKLSKDLETAGVAVAERKTAVIAAQRQWEKELAEVIRSIASFERDNTAKFEQVTQQMFTRLYHEAFHAYLESFVYPHDKYDVPRWLNEGLAQIFEEGILEVGTLRLDMPSTKRLKALQADLRNTARLPLAELLAADGQSFLVAHPTTVETSQRYYLYSWGLAYYLAVREPVLETAALNRYVERSAEAGSPVIRFEGLVGMPLHEFEHKWRKEMLEIKPAK